MIAPLLHVAAARAEVPRGALESGRSGGRRIPVAQHNNPTGDTGLPRVLFGYEVVERLGEGAHSTIYAVSDPKTKQLYALKHVVRGTEKEARYVEQAENEYNISRQFRHPALRRAFDFKTSRKGLFGPVVEAALVMELVHGYPINERLSTDLAAIIPVFTQTAAALLSMHMMKLVHCDLKPNNIMVDAGGAVKVIDFGQACPVGTEKPRVQGTPDFISPEQVRLKPVSVRTDVYNFGATLYWALTRQRVPTLYTVGKEQKHVLKEQQYPSPIDLNPVVPERVSKVVMECVRYRPAERPVGIQEVLDVLELYGTAR
jgi:eukaryotic-like serine/threonine-protein kinase